jgi:hypothetical protein
MSSEAVMNHCLRGINCDKRALSEKLRLNKGEMRLCLCAAHGKLADIEGFDHVPRIKITEKHLAIEVGERVVMGRTTEEDGNIFEKG